MIDLKTHKELLEIMLGNLQATEDKSPNSFSYDNLSSVAVLGEEFLQQIYYLSLLFDIENLESDELETRVFQITGLTRKQATRAYGLVEITGVKGTVIPEDTIFLAGDKEYFLERAYTIPDEGTLSIMVRSLDFGPEGNVIAGAITKTRPGITGITSVENTLEIDNGYSTETDDQLRERYYYKLQNPPKAGNPSHYKLWAEEVEGVGNAKVFRTWNGPSTVKVVIVGMDRTGVDEELVKKVHDHIMAEAPIHWENLTVESAKELALNLTFKLTLQNGYTLEEVKKAINENIETYLYDVSFRQSFVSYAKVGGAILATQGVADYEDLTINGIMDNIELEEIQVGVLGTVEVV